MILSIGKMFAILLAPDKTLASEPEVADCKDVPKLEIIAVIIVPIPTTIPAINGVRKLTCDFIEDVISAASKAEQERHSTMAAKLRYEIDAAGKESLNAAENLRSDASRRSALRLKLADKIESIIRESVKPMSNINDIKIIDVNGLPGFSGNSNGSGGGTSESVGTKDGAAARSGNLADNVVSSALRYRAHQPFLDGLLKEIGMAPGEVSNIRNILGDYENPKKDFHMNFDKDPTKGTKDPK